jgi:IS30 family transposase
MNIHVLSKQGFSYAEIGRLIGRDWRTVKRAGSGAFLVNAR